MNDNNENANDLTGLDVSATDGAPIGDSETEKIVAILDGAAPKKRIKKRYICFALIALALGGAGIAWGMSGSSQPEQPAEGDRPVVVAEKKKAEKADLNLHVDADGWTDKSTPVIVHIESEDGKINTYHAFKANEDCAVEVNPGTYTINYISPINTDGSIYKTSDPQEARVSGKEDEQAEATLATFEIIPADEVTQEQIDSILSQIKDAVAKGDEILSGDTGKEIVDAAASNAAAAPNVDKEKVTEQAEQAKQLVQETPPASTTTDNGASNANAGSSGAGSNGGSDSNAQSSGSNSGSSTPDDGGSTGGNSNGGSTTAPDPTPTPTPDPTPSLPRTSTIGRPEPRPSTIPPNTSSSGCRIWSMFLNIHVGHAGVWLLPMRKPQLTKRTLDEEDVVPFILAATTRTEAPTSPSSSATHGLRPLRPAMLAPAAVPGSSGMRRKSADFSDALLFIQLV